MVRKVRVLQICHDAKGPFLMVAQQYAQYFADCEIRTIFLCGDNSPELVEAIPGDVDCLLFDSVELRGLKLSAVAKVAALIENQAPDILIAHRYKPFFIALLLRIKMFIPLILGVIHEYGFLRRRSRSILSRLWPDNVSLIAVSETICKEISSEFPHLSGRVHVVPHSMDEVHFIDSMTARQRLGIPRESYCFGVIGRLVWKKNHELLLRAFAELEEEPVLALVGDGPLKGDLEELALELGIDHRVIFCGHQENAKTLIRAFDSFVLPSGEEESFGVVLLEAMAASVPILSSDAAGPKSVISDSAITFRCDNKHDLVDKLKRMQSLTEQEIEDFASRGSHRLDEKFSIGVVSQKVRSLPEVAKLAPYRVEHDL